MRYLKYFALLAILMVPMSYSQAQVRVGIGFGPGYVAGPPVCSYGYYNYYPYACAPYGYYGPSWFSGGVFIGAGPWFHGGWGRGYYGSGWGRGRGYYGTGWRGGYYGRGSAFAGRGYAGRGFVGGRSVGGGFRGGPVGGFHGGSGFHGGGGFHGGRR